MKGFNYRAQFNGRVSRWCDRISQHSYAAKHWINAGQGSNAMPVIFWSWRSWSVKPRKYSWSATSLAHVISLHTYTRFDRELNRWFLNNGWVRGHVNPQNLKTICELWVGDLKVLSKSLWRRITRLEINYKTCVWYSDLGTRIPRKHLNRKNGNTNHKLSETIVHRDAINLLCRKQSRPPSPDARFGVWADTVTKYDFFPLSHPTRLVYAWLLVFLK